MLKNYKPYTEIMPIEIAEKMQEMSGFYYSDEASKAQELDELINVIYQLKAYAENSYNADYWRTLYGALQCIADN